MKKSKELYKYDLDYHEALKYTFDVLEGGNELAKYLAANLNFNHGMFFTLLPKEAHLNQINDYSYGGILDQDCHTHKKIQPVPNLDVEIAEYLFNYQIGCKNKFIFENVVYKSLENCFVIQNVSPVVLNDQIYYIINRVTSSETIYETLKTNLELWYFLCVATSANVDLSRFDHLQFEQICVSTHLLVFSAYDGEGFIFWEKNK